MSRKEVAVIVPAAGLVIATIIGLVLNWSGQTIILLFMCLVGFMFVMFGVIRDQTEMEAFESINNAAAKELYEAAEPHIEELSRRQNL